MCTRKLSNLSKLPWSMAQAMLAPSMGGYDATEEVNSGQAYPFYIGEAGKGSATLIRTENHEMVIVGFVGCMKDAAPTLFELAEAIQANSVRIHTKRRGELRYLHQLGYPFELSETKGDEFVLRMVM